ncbi:MAG TPA: carbohydrate kinase [Marmoricola sp.]|nr:carbohydrate kinase [Marmoricola sp.]HNI69942.1 carbohydrate kinase [Marmoricola sp.]HNO39310.1 carbohydrate kinase [Marmoricola sp.]
MIVVVGESLVDVVTDASGQVTRTPGGSPLNVAIGLGRLKVETLLMTQLGNDKDAELILRALRDSRVAVMAAPARNGRTSSATAQLDADGEATYSFNITWDLPEQDLPRCDAVHIGSLGTLLEPGRQSVLELVEEATAHKHMLSYDINLRAAHVSDPETTWRDVVSVASRASLVRLSEADSELMRPGVPADQVCRELLRGSRTRVVVLTRGAAGATAFGEDFEVSAEPREVNVADTIGAGDAFTAGLLAMLDEARMLGHDKLPTDAQTWEALLAGAVEIASITCERRGANPPTRDEVSADFTRHVAHVRKR